MKRWSLSYHGRLGRAGKRMTSLHMRGPAFSNKSLDALINRFESMSRFFESWLIVERVGNRNDGATTSSVVLLRGHIPPPVSFLAYDGPALELRAFHRFPKRMIAILPFTSLTCYAVFSTAHFRAIGIYLALIQTAVPSELCHGFTPLFPYFIMSLYLRQFLFLFNVWPVYASASSK